jgi:hypothetical protein
MSVVRLKLRSHAELDTANDEVGKALVPLVERHGVLEVATILVGCLAEIIVRVHARRNVDCDEWLDGLRRQFNGAMGSGRGRRLWGALVALLGGCAHPPPLVYHATVIPPYLVEPVCARTLWPQ